MAHKLVRIKPGNKRDSHHAHGITIKKSDGWCKVGAAIADLLAKEKMNELNPEASADVFDVLDPAVAAEIDAAEQEKNEPAGTISDPKEKIPAVDPEAADAPRRTVRGTGR